MGLGEVVNAPIIGRPYFLATKLTASSPLIGIAGYEIRI